MKIRIGFVSNSSSTSFAIYGFATYIDKDTLTKEQILQLLINIKNFIERKMEKEESVKNLNSYIDMINEILDNSDNSNFDLYGETHVFLGCYLKGIAGLDVHIDPYDKLYIGKDITEMSDDQTLREFKEETAVVLKDIFSRDKNTFRILTAGWFDG